MHTYYIYMYILCTDICMYICVYTHTHSIIRIVLVCVYVCLPWKFFLLQYVLMTEAAAIRNSLRLTDQAAAPDGLKVIQ